MGEGRKKCLQSKVEKREAKEADKIEVAPGVTNKLETFSSRVDWTNPRTP